MSLTGELQRIEVRPQDTYVTYSLDLICQHTYRDKTNDIGEF